MKKENLIHARTCVYNVNYHIVFSTKYRKAVLKGGVEEYLKQLFKDIADEKGFTISSMEVMEDHVHLFVKAPPTASPHWIVQQLKGYTSHELRKEFSHLKSRLPTLWTRSYYVESCGHISEQTIKRYIEEQKNK